MNGHGQDVLQWIKLRYLGMTVEQIHEVLRGDVAISPLPRNEGCDVAKLPVANLRADALYFIS